MRPVTVMIGFARDAEHLTQDAFPELAAASVLGIEIADASPRTCRMTAASTPVSRVRALLDNKHYGPCTSAARAAAERVCVWSV